MRMTIVLAALGLASSGCSEKPELRPEAPEVKVTVKLPGGAPAKDLSLMLQPQQNTQPAAGKVGSDGSLTVKLAPGKYIPVFDESNAKHPAYNSIPQSYRSPNEANSITVDSSGSPINVQVK